MTLGTFICKRVTHFCPFLTMCTGPKQPNENENTWYVGNTYGWLFIRLAWL